MKPYIESNIQRPRITVHSESDESETDSQNTSQQATSESDPDKFYEVEKIIGHRTYKGRKQFLVKWKDYGSDENSWISIKDANPALRQAYRNSLRK